MTTPRTPSPAEKDAGTQESHQDQHQDDVAKRRPGQNDQKVHDENTRRPQRKDGSQEPG